MRGKFVGGKCSRIWNECEQNAGLMGVTNSLELIKPATYSDLIKRMQDFEQNPSVSSLENLFWEMGKPFDDYFAESLVEACGANDPIKVSSFMNQVLKKLGSEQTFYLDKSLRPLERIFFVVDEMKPLRKLVRFDGFDVPVPRQFAATDCGVWGIWSYKPLQECAGPIDEFSTMEQVKTYQALRKFSFWERLVGKPAKINDCLQLLVNDQYCWDNWNTFGSAIKTALARKWHLGFYMSP